MSEEGKRRNIKNTHCVVINCARSVERLANFTKHAKKAGLKFKRQNCIDARQFIPNDQAMCQLYREGLVKPEAEMVDSEIAISFSHRESWLSFLKTNKKYGLTLEDDFDVVPSFVKDVELILKHVEDNGIEFDVLFLFSANWAHSKSKQKLVTTVELSTGKKLKIMRETVIYNAAGSAYILSRKFAEKLVHDFIPIYTPVDEYLGEYWHTGKNLVVDNFKDKDNCWVTLLGKTTDCGGLWGTGNSTQTHNHPTMSSLDCPNKTKWNLNKRGNPKKGGKRADTQELNEFFKNLVL